MPKNDVPDDYINWTNNQKKAFLSTEYQKKKKSFGVIAKDVGTYPNKLRRDAKKFKIKIRNKSEAQKQSLESGVSTHPTQGKKRSEKIRTTISEKLSQKWVNMDDKTRQKYKKIGKDSWEKKTLEEKKLFLKKANQSVRLASKTGSKLEKFLHQSLVKNNYKCLLHQEHLIVNEKLHIDILLPELNIAIEVDGVSHRESNVWGNKALKRTQRADQEKESLLMARGLVVIRIVQNRKLSRKYKMDILESLIFAIEKVEDKFPDRKNRLIKIEI